MKYETLEYIHKLLVENDELLHQSLAVMIDKRREAVGDGVELSPEQVAGNDAIYAAWRKAHDVRLDFENTNWR